MSQSIARILHSIITATTAPLSHRQQAKTRAALQGLLNEKAVSTVNSKHGPITFFGQRSHYTSSAVTRFFDDEPDTLTWIDETIKPNEILWDIGANIGLYSLYAAKRGHIAIYAFEPSALNFGLLVEHVALNKCGHTVHPLCVALSDRTGIFPLHMSALTVGRAGNSLHTPVSQSGAFTSAFSQTVPGLRGDDAVTMLGVPRPHHIKLDVDGIEGAILAGMPQVLAHVRSVLVEVEGANADAADTLIEAPLKAAGLVEDMAFRARGNPRNRLFVRGA